MKLSNLVNVIDVEATCWEPANTQPLNEISEIIEIGIAVVNTEKLLIENNDSIIIKPQGSKLSNFCTELTTLTQKDVDAGVSFQEAISILKKKYSSNNRVFVSWGDYDRKMFERNCQDYQIKYPFGPRHLNLKNTFAVLHGLPHELGMDQALEYLKLPLNGTHHRGIHDSRNIAEIFINVLKQFRKGNQNV